MPGHTRFDEINLRFYVKRTVGDEVRRGVVFTVEIVPRRAVAIVANRLYNENYVTRPMRRLISMAGGENFDTGDEDRIWVARRRRRSISPSKGTRLEPTCGRCRDAARNSGGWVAFEEFIVEHYWGYGSDRHGRTIQIPSCTPDVASVHGGRYVLGMQRGVDLSTPFARYLMTEPASAIIAEGSAVQVFGGRRLETKVVDSSELLERD